MLLYSKQRINNHARGFFMMEALLYLALFGFSMTLFMNALMNVTNAVRSTGNQTYHCMEITSALDLFGRDVWSTQRQGVIVLDERNLIMQTSQNAYGWQWDKNDLYRIQGTYDVHEHVWKKRKRNKVVGDIEQFEYHFDESHNCMHVMIRKDVTVQRIFAGKNGVVI